MAAHTTYKRTAEGRTETRNRRAMRALKYRETSLTVPSMGVSQGYSLTV